MDIKQYKELAKPLAVTLTGGQELSLSYYPNYMTGERIEELAKRTIDSKSKPLVEADEDGTPRLNIEVMYEDYVDHLASAIATIDLTDNGKPLPFKSKADKQKTLRVFSYDDVQLISSKISDDLNAPLEKTGTDSSAGQAQKDE